MAEERGRVMLQNALKDAVRKAGSQKAFADSIGLSASYISDVLNFRREPGERLMDAVGWARSISYYKVKP